MDEEIFPDNDSQKESDKSSDLKHETGLIFETLLNLIGKLGSGLFWFIKTALLMFIFALIIRYILIEPFWVDGQSMESSFHHHDYLIIDKFSYHFRAPQRGEVIVFKFPADPRKNFIKRVIGLPYETVEIKNGKVVIYNKNNPKGFRLEENYIKVKPGEGTYGDLSREIGKDEYFVLGDNREPNMSEDSRYPEVGNIPKVNIVGRAWIRLWPRENFGIIKKPEYSTINFYLTAFDSILKNSISK